MEVNYQAAVKQHGGIRPAARELGIPESTLRRKLSNKPAAEPVRGYGYLNIYRDPARGFRAGKLKSQPQCGAGSIAQVRVEFVEAQFDE